MIKSTFCLLLLTACLGQSLFAEDTPERIYPAVLSQRDIAPTAGLLPGTTNVIQEGVHEFTLFIPEGWKLPANGEVPLTIHFHGAIWFAIQEHLRRDLKHPLVAFHPGEGSGRYQRAFTDEQRFSRLLKVVEEELSKSSDGAPATISGVSISSYSAGYGAVREILKSAEHRKIIKRVVLADSMYGDYAKDEQGNLTNVPASEHIDPYVPFARAAAEGEKTFVITFSQVRPGTYASAAECGAALVQKVGGTFEEVELDSSAAANDPNFPLLKRCDIRNFHVWSYAGNDAPAHMTHARHIADIWRILDEAGKP